MATIKNISNGPRGAYIGSALVMVEAGATAEGEFTDVNSEWFEGGDAVAEPGPLDGSVEELEKHLAAIDDPAEIDRLIEAETAGKSRKGALAALEARRDELNA